MTVHLNSMHMNKIIESSQGFGIFENVKVEPTKRELICDKCDYIATQTCNLKRHLKKS